MKPLNDRTFKEYSDFLYQTTGINMQANKKHLLDSKLNRLLSKNNLGSADDYIGLLSRPQNASQRQEFINMMTTNTTEFFRESNHFSFLQDRLDLIMGKNPRIKQEKTIRVWSAACSSGQEPVTIALVLKQLLGDYQVRILATDINTRVLSKAVEGVYSEGECLGVPRFLLNAYFEKCPEGYRLGSEIRSLITYRQFNLMNEYSFKWGFDIIFCRNVLIYFDQQVQQQLINKFYGHLVGGGLLFLGHSESMVNKKHRFKSIGNSIYLKA